MKLQELYELRESKLADIEALVELAKSEAQGEEESRSFTKEEENKFDALYKEVEGLDEQISSEEKKQERLKKLAERRNAYKGNPNKDKESDLVESFSYGRFFQAALSERKFEGAEAEAHAEGVKQNRGKKGFSGRAELPGWFMDLRTDAELKQERTVLDTTTANQGGDLIETSVAGSVIPALRPRTFLNTVGVTYMPGLTNPLSMPRVKTGATAAWRGEGSNAADAGVQFEEFTLTPKHLSCYQEYYMELLMQANPRNVDRILREDFSIGMGVELSNAALNGAGSNDPTGVINHASVSVVAAGTDGAAPTQAIIASLVEKIEEENADVMSMYFVTNQKVKRKAKTTTLDAGSGQFLYDYRTNYMDAYPVAISTQAPSNLTKGSSIGICSALFFGDWSQWIVAQFGGISFIVNPYTGDLSNKVRITMHTHWDMNARHGEALAVCKDLLTT